AAKFNFKSSDKLRIRLTFTPDSGLNSKFVTVGPCVTLTTDAPTLKCLGVLSKKYFFLVTKLVFVSSFLIFYYCLKDYVEFDFLSVFPFPFFNCYYSNV